MRGNLYEAAVLCPVLRPPGGWPVPNYRSIGDSERDLESLARSRSLRLSALRSGSTCALSCLAVAAAFACSSPVAAAAATASRPTPTSTPPVTGQTGDEVPAGGPPLGFPVFATKNTTRVAGGDAIADAAAVALATYPARTPESRPAAVILAEVRDWRTGHRRVRAGRQADQRADPVRRRRQDPGRDEGRAGRAAAHRLQGGRRRAGHPRRDQGAGRGLQDDRRRGRQPGRAGRGRRPRCRPPRPGAPSSAVVVASLGPPGVRDARRRLGGQVRRPAAVGDRARASRRRPRPRSRPTSRPRSTCSGPPDAVPDTVLDALGKLGTVKRIAGDRPGHQRDHLRALHRTATFGWYVVDPGHGLVFAYTRRPQDAAAAAPLSASGTYGPLLLLTDAGVLPAAAAGLPARHPARLRRRPGPRRLQPRLDHRRRERDRRRRPGPHRYALGDPARRHRSPVSMAEAEQPERLRGDREVTVDDVRQLVASATPHFALPDPQPHPDADHGPARPTTRCGSTREAEIAKLRVARLHRRGPRDARAARHARSCRASASTEQPRYMPGATAAERIRHG